MNSLKLFYGNRIICTQENEEKISQFIREIGFSIKNRYDRGIIILELEFTNNYDYDDLKKLIALQDNLLDLS